MMQLEFDLFGHIAAAKAEAAAHAAELAEIENTPLPFSREAVKEMMAYRAGFTFTGKDGQASDKDCEDKEEVLRALLAKHCPDETFSERFPWFTMKLADGRWRGVRAQTPTEAALRNTFWWGSKVVSVHYDPDTLLLDHYLPRIHQKDME